MVEVTPATDERPSVRPLVFNLLAVIVLAPTVKALADRKVFELFDGPSLWTSLDEILEHTHGNRGYLRVALRLLVCAGWLEARHDQSVQGPAYALTTVGAVATKLAPPLYAEVASFISKAIFLEDFLFSGSDEPILPSLRELVARAQSRWTPRLAGGPISDKVCDQIRKHLDGMLIGPAMVALARGGILKQLEQEPASISSIAANPHSLACLFDLLATQRSPPPEHHSAP